MCRSPVAASTAFAVQAECRLRLAFEGRANFLEQGRRQSVGAELSSLWGILAAYVPLSVVAGGRRCSAWSSMPRFGIDPRTAKKMLSYSAPPGQSQPSRGRVIPRAGPSHGLPGQATVEARGTSLRRRTGT